MDRVTSVSLHAVKVLDTLRDVYFDDAYHRPLPTARSYLEQ